MNHSARGAFKVIPNKVRSFMQKTIASICAVAVAAVTLGAALPASAASPIGGAQFVPVAQYNNQYNNDHRRFEMRGHYAYNNGQRGDRHRHPGWRQYNGYWFPPAAFIGAVVGGAILGGILHSH